MDYYKKDRSGAILIPGRHNVNKYIKDMEKRNQGIRDSQMNDFRREVQAGALHYANKILGISSKSKGSAGGYRKGWEVIYGDSKK